MFNNPFLKKDPLVEAVQSAMQDGDLRRQAEALVNEEFGVYSRKAVVREQLAAYDARLEEAYKCMKEGEKLAKKDYDKDGKIESPKDEVWGSRFRAAKMAGKMEEEQIDEISKGLAGRYKDKAHASYTYSAGKRSDDEFVSGPGKKMTDASGKPKFKERSKEAQKADDKTIQKRLKGLGMAHKRLSKEETQIDERNLLKRMKDTMRLGSSGKERVDRISGALSDRGGNWDYKKGDFTEKGKSQVKSRLKNVKGASDYALNKEETQIDEVSAGLARRAAHHAFVKSDKMKKDAQKEPDMHSYVQAFHKGEKKSKQGTKFAKYAAKKMEESQVDEAAYSAKAARAGKDIGKPGKMFSKIAAKAGEKYGSEERGKKVAGAILKRIRAKHMKEDSSFNAAQITGKSVNEAPIAMPPAVQQPAPAVRGPAAKLQGNRFYRGLNASTSGTGSARFVNPQTARVSAPPPPKTGTSVAPSGNRMPAAGGSTGTSASRSLTTGASRNVTAAPKATASGGSGFTYSRLGDREIGAAASGARSAARSIVSKVAGRALGVAGLAVPDSTKTEPGNPVFRKRDDGRTEVAGYRSSTTPRSTDVNTTSRMVGDASRRGGIAPGVKKQELPSKIAPVQTKEPGTLSAPSAPKASEPAKQTFSQAFAAARKEAGSGKGQFEFGGKKFQTNIAPAKGAEKYIAPSAQKATSVGKAPDVEPSTTATPKATTPGSTSIAKQPAPSASATAGMSAAAEKSGISQTPTKSGTEFGAGKDVSSTPMPTSSTSSSTPAKAPEPAPQAPKDDEKKAKGSVSTMNESIVTVGSNKYRIV